MLHVSLLLPAVKLLETLSEYEIASPIRVNALGEPVSTNVHFKRRRRSINAASDPWPASASSSPSSSTSDQEHYRLSAFGQQFLFNLSAHSGFIAPLFTVTLLGTPGENQTKFYSEEEAELKHCFYKGHVNTKSTKSQHTAVISLCSGMVSWCPLLSPPLPPLHKFLEDFTALSSKTLTAPSFQSGSEYPLETSLHPAVWMTSPVRALTLERSARIRSQGFRVFWSFLESEPSSAAPCPALAGGLEVGFQTPELPALPCSKHSRPGAEQLSAGRTRLLIGASRVRGVS